MDTREYLFDTPVEADKGEKPRREYTEMTKNTSQYTLDVGIPQIKTLQ